MPTLIIDPANLDSIVSEGNPDAWQDVSAYLNVNAPSNTSRSILRFDFSALPAFAVISSAVMSVYLSSYLGPADIRAVRITQPAWINRVSWNKYDLSNAWDTLGGDFTLDDSVLVDVDGILQYHEWEIADMVTWFQENNGEVADIMMKLDDEASLYSLVFHSANNGTFKPKLTITYEVLFNGDVDITLPLLSVDAIGDRLSGDVSITFPALTVAIAASFDDDVAFDLPVITLSARSYRGSVPECLVMNTTNFSVSEFANYGFNSMTKFNGLNLIADQNGIYELDGSDLDAEAYKIKSRIKTGVIDIYTTQINRVRDSYLMYRSDGDVRLTTKADKKTTRTYLVAESASDSNVVKRRRIKFERGIKNRHFDFKLENVNGSAFEIDVLTVETEPVISKRR